jgi:hypothetical protein
MTRLFNEISYLQVLFVCGPVSRAFSIVASVGPHWTIFATGSNRHRLPPISPPMYALKVITIPHSSRIASKTMNTGVGVMAALC